MNILPKKSWHVRNKDNVAKVRRDERKAKEEAEELEKRRILAEKEAKIDALRRKSNTDVDAGGCKGSVSKPTGHVNFFKEFEEESKAVTLTNKDYEKEKKSEQEAFEKKIGLLTYLGQSVPKSKDERPWYLQQSSSAESADQIEERKKHKLDPLKDVDKYLKIKDKHGKKEKDKKKKKKYSEMIEHAPSSSSSSIEELRAKRLKREREERRKAEQLLAGKSGKTEIQTDKTEYDPTRYSSQYNPELARKKRDQRRYEPY